jgi:Mrp family chromosome partitioning ATPase
MAGAFPASGDPPGAEAAQPLWRMIDDRLRGRWRWMLIIGGALSLVFGVVGYLSTGPRYRSTGAIRVSSNITPVLEQQPEHMVTKSSVFITTQMQLLQSRRVLEQAIKDKELAVLPLAQQADAILRLEEDLTVESDRDSELIFVSFDGETARLAQTVVNAVIRAYDDIFGSASGDEVTKKLQQLNEYKAGLTRDLQAIKTRKQAILARYDTRDLIALQERLLDRLEETDHRIAAAQVFLQRHGARDDQAETVPENLGPSPLQLEQFDPRLAQVRQDRDESENTFQVIRQTYKPGTFAYKRAEDAARTAEQVYQAQVARTRERWMQSSANGLLPEGSGDVLVGLPPERVEAELGNFKSLAEQLRTESRQLSADLQAIDDFKSDEARIQNDLDHTVSRIERLELEESPLRTQRIQVAQWGFAPIAPSNDTRHKRAAAGLVGGMLVSFAGFFLLGTVDRRAFGAHQLSQAAGGATPPCLGVLPDLGASALDPESSDVAAHCVHQIRNQIEALREPHDGYVLAVSSPFQGDGKTSIVMALGWSYAAAGYSTLLIDCDMIGRSLTRQLGMVGREGLKEALIGRGVNGEVACLTVPNLSALPVGVDPRVGSESLRRRDLAALLEPLRRAYEIIIVDTGPLLGSLESTPVTSAADGVILSVRRGRSRSRLEECVQRLDSVGAACIGVVLNCAVRSDCNRYVSEASLAAAEDERTVRSGVVVEEKSVVRATPGEGNLLMRAMETTARRRQAAVGADDEA